MTAIELLRDLTVCGVALSVNGDQLNVDARDELLTDELLNTLRDHKAELLTLLQAKPAERPRHGSFARPVICRGNRMPAECPWDTCAGQVEAKGHRRYQCSTCSTWFELKPTDFGVYLGDLADDFGAVATEREE